MAIRCLEYTAQQSTCQFIKFKQIMVYSFVFILIGHVSDSAQLSTKFILLINAKMPTIVGILAFVSMKYTTSESLKARTVCIFQHFRLHEL